MQGHWHIFSWACVQSWFCFTYLLRQVLSPNSYILPHPFFWIFVLYTLFKTSEMDYFLPYQRPPEKDITAVSNCSLQSEMVSPKVNSEGAEHLRSSSHQTTATPYSKPWRKANQGKPQAVHTCSVMSNSCRSGLQTVAHQAPYP